VGWVVYKIELTCDRSGICISTGFVLFCLRYDMLCYATMDTCTTAVSLYLVYSHPATESESEEK
jgi:hypothetical protein